MTAAAASEYTSISGTAAPLSPSSPSAHIHVVNKSGEFCSTPDDITKFMGAHGLMGDSYSVFAIMGAQSSGKSTLLNCLFGTKFEELNSQVGRQMTTKGVWFGASPSIPGALVMDLEGTDSVSRGQDRHPFERQSSLLALSVAEVLIINMWQHDIGRYVASNYGVLATVFEVNLQLLSEQLRSSSTPNKTLLLFTIRDHSESDSPLEVIAAQLRMDMDRIWSDLKLPAGLSYLTMDQLFDIEFVALPHKKFETDKFMADVDHLRERLMSDRSLGGGLAGVRKTSSVPASGLGHFVSTIWDTIVNHKDLNLPSQKEMLAIFRCEEEMTTIIETFKTSSSSLKQRVDEGYMGDFAIRCDTLTNDALERFEQTMSGYHEGTVKRKRGDLQQRLAQELKAMWSQQMSYAKKSALKYYQSEMQAQLPKQKASHRFNDISAQTQLLSMSQLQKMSEQITPTSSGPWSIEPFRAQLNGELQGAHLALREEQLSKLSSEVQGKINAQLIPEVTRAFEAAAPQMWSTIQTTLDEWVAEVSDSLIDRKLGGIDPDRLPDFQQRVQLEAIAALKQEAHKYTTFIKQRMQKRFDMKFRLDEQGLPRVWHEERDLRSIYLAARTQAESILTLFTRFGLSEPSFDSSASPSPTTRKPMVLLSEADCSSALSSLYADCQVALDAAETSASRSRQLSHIPLWIYPLLGVLGANEAMTILAHPFLAFLAVVTLILAGVIYYLQLSEPVIALGKVLVRQISTQVVGYLNQEPDQRRKVGSPRKRSPRRKSPPSQQQQD